MLIIEKAIKALKDNVVQMTDVVSKMVQTINKAIQEENYHELDTIFQQDRTLDALEKDTDQQSIELLALINPRASDLRFVFSVIKLDVDLERIGDECKNIARELQNTKNSLPSEIKDMSSEVLKMIEDVFVALNERNAALAKDVVMADDKVDKLEYQVLNTYKDKLEFAFTAKALERIADHATNVAEKVVFTVEGLDIRHENSLIARLEQKEQKETE